MSTSPPVSQKTWHERVEQQPAPRPAVDSPADWLMVFDTEFSPNLAIKIRTTRQIPVSGGDRDALLTAGAGSRERAHTHLPLFSTCVY